MISQFDSAINERKVERTYVTISSKTKNIYKIDNLSFQQKNLIEGYKYRISFFAEMAKQTIDAVYYGATDNCRTLIVSNPYDTVATTLGIPSYNIVSINPVV